jgi:hypothetical protein
MATVAALSLTACGGKKQSEDIIATRVVQPVSHEPSRMQDYSDDRDVAWIGKTYHVSIHRWSTDSLPLVSDETGRRYVDNLITVAVSRKDGSLFFRRTFRKTDFLQHLDADYAKTGIMEGLVFDRADGDWLVFAASVSHPGSDDEYIPLVVRLSRMGVVEVSRDTQMMDVSAEAPATADEEDGV